jgi:hypothetical protein
VILTSANDCEIKFWVPPTNWIGEDKFKPNLEVEEIEREIKSSIKIQSTTKVSPSKKSKKKRK